MDGGRVWEFDSPAKLLSDKRSAFYAMAKDAGVTLPDDDLATRSRDVRDL